MKKKTGCAGLKPRARNPSLAPPARARARRGAPVSALLRFWEVRPCPCCPLLLLPLILRCACGFLPVPAVPTFLRPPLGLASLSTHLTSGGPRVCVSSVRAQLIRRGWVWLLWLGLFHDGFGGSSQSVNTAAVPRSHSTHGYSKQDQELRRARGSTCRMGGRPGPQAAAAGASLPRCSRPRHAPRCGGVTAAESTASHMRTCVPVHDTISSNLQTLCRASHCKLDHRSW